MTRNERFASVIDAIDALVSEPAPVRFSANPVEADDIDAIVSASLARGPHDAYDAAWGRTVETEDGLGARRSRANETCPNCGGQWHGQPNQMCEGSFEDFSADNEALYPFYTVEFQVEVANDVAASPRDAALLALRSILTGEITCTVTSPSDAVTEIDVSTD